ncbi:methylated-DNA--[protein]-cysteine S-methyltransferase [Clostridium sp. YIM B02505]|uniref:Methylated-DNA--protein-cysteine methyltransferase n=1 Tax=Clostridium yunnanense TaxID=2800325 RepID=A0ABS1EJS3_9CLOT|nr:methylated-DNA--[protein]-cysteine S-methyltransferase [Clostridium yunnanense]MBK1809609.1 methylated-DNA--[protein]-cysteine S-methyltransferase [Clostridium yunnanense]
MNTYYTGYYSSPVGLIKVQSNTDYIVSLDFIDNKLPDDENHNFLITNCLNQLQEYFEGKRVQFNLPLLPSGTDFQKAVWSELMNVPFGSIKTYKDIAVAINNPKAVRAVGGANNKNPIPLIIPCHRIIGSSGKLVGYGGGLWRKEWLLNHEKVK